MSVTRNYSKSLSLDQLQELVTQEERLFGRMLSIAAAAEKTACEYEATLEPAPTSPPILLPFTGDQPSRPGFALVCAGKAFVSGVETRIAVFRIA